MYFSLILFYSRMMSDLLLLTVKYDRKKNYYYKYVLKLVKLEKWSIPFKN